MYQVPPQPGEAWWQARLRRHLGELFRLAWPTVISRVGILTIVLADLMMVGQYGTDDLAFFAIGAVPIIPVIVGGVGLMMGTLVLSSNAFGAGDFKACGGVWRHAMPYAALIGVLALVFCSFGELLLTALGQSDEMAARGGDILFILGLGLPFILLYQVSNFFLEGIKRPGPGMVVMVLANIINLGLNWLLIEGHWGAQELGAAGAAWATTACRVFLCVTLVLYVWFLKDRGQFGVRLPAPGGWRGGGVMRRIGYATGLSNAVESGAFASMSVFAGWIGSGAIAAYTVSFNRNAIFFMFALGLGAATSVRVGIAYGRRDWPDLRLAGWTGIGTSTFFMVLFAAALILAPDFFASFYSEDPDLLILAAELITLVGLVLVMDGNQAVAAQALRGMRDVWIPTALQTFCFIGVMVPLGHYLAFDGGLGVHGLVWAIFIATFISFVLLSARFIWVSRAHDRVAENSYQKG